MRAESKESLVAIMAGEGLRVWVWVGKDKGSIGRNVLAIVTSLDALT